MRAIVVYHPNIAIAVPESHHVLAQQANTHRRTVPFRNFLRQEDGLPEPPHEVAHGRTGAYV
jgi:hypothetical protein